MIKTILACVLVLTLTGCARFNPHKLAKLSLQQQSYFLVSKSDIDLCYTRVIKGTPRDQVCTQENLIRYIPDPKLDEETTSIPNVITAIFDEHQKPTTAH